MTDQFRSYLKECGATPLDPTSWQDYLAAMQAVIPAILKDVSEREQLAAELRYAPTTSARAREDKA